MGKRTFIVNYEDFSNSSGVYMSRGRCPLSIAARRVFKAKEAWAGKCSITVVKYYLFGLLRVETTWTLKEPFSYNAFKELRNSAKEFRTSLTRQR